MLCSNPYHGPAGLHGCGQCLPCRLNRRRIWAHRIQLEALMHGDNCFQTLTYNDENLPENSTLVPKHLQDYIKRLRSSVAPHKIRFYGVGEYGDDSERPHYHVAVFGHSTCRYLKCALC